MEAGVPRGHHEGQQHLQVTSVVCVNDMGRIRQGGANTVRRPQRALLKLRLGALLRAVMLPAPETKSPCGRS